MTACALVKDSNEEAFLLTVNRYLEEGWTTVGGPFSHREPHGQCFCLLMTREAETTEERKESNIYEDD